MTDDDPGRLRRLWWRFTRAVERRWYDFVTARARRYLDRAAAPMLPDAESLIPRNLSYCYDDRVCPFWHRMGNLPEQRSGYCSYLRMGDWQPGADLLWDQVKLCGVNRVRRPSVAEESRP
jgi:hypothetical protein